MWFRYNWSSWWTESRVCTGLKIEAMADVQLWQREKVRNCVHPETARFREHYLAPNYTATTCKIISRRDVARLFLLTSNFLRVVLNTTFQARLL